MKTPPSQPRPESEPNEMERVAAEWALRLSQGFSADDEHELTRWLAEDPRHAQLLAEMEETSRLLDGLKFQVPAPVTSSAATPTVAPAPAATSASAPASAPRRRWGRLAAGVAAAIAIGVGAWQFTAWRAMQYVTTASTRLGEFRQLDLPDGSVVKLNTNTAVEISYDRGERRVRLLSGEAYFAVAKNPARPFIVQAGRIAVRAVGTAFDVRLRREELNVLVTEGKVRVSGDDAPPTIPGEERGSLGPVLTVGHLARVPLDQDRAPTPGGMVVTPLEARTIRNTLAWRDGRLEFFELPLGEVVAEFNRYNRNQIVITDPALAAQRFGGAFASHQAEPFLELLEQSFGVVAEQHGNETFIRRAK